MESIKIVFLLNLIYAKSVIPMKVLYVVGANLSRNTSANISHNAYVKGLLENNCDVDIIMATSSWGDEDEALPKWKDATYFTYNSVSLREKIKFKFKNFFDKSSSSKNKTVVNTGFKRNTSTVKINLKAKIRTILKSYFDLIFNTSHLYNLDRSWLKNASNFKSGENYDLIISNSSPASSHKLVLNLLSKNRIKYKRWIQIWEDPWYFDLYGGHDLKVKEEEHFLLRAAEEIFYVSPLTLKYQQIHFPDCAAKMKHIPLPYLKFNDDKRPNLDVVTFGYFGDYYSKTRNLLPFFEALIASRGKGFIYGDSDLSIKHTDKLEIEGRVTLNKLTLIQNQSTVLVHLCNLRGGQIPGKIYHYSATKKPILFILDGTKEEIGIIKTYFQKFNRYHFCENTKEDILKVIDLFLKGYESFEKKPVAEFAPKAVIEKLISKQI